MYTYVRIVLPLLPLSNLKCMELLIKATPDVRTPVYKGQFAESQMHYFSTN